MQPSARLRTPTHQASSTRTQLPAPPDKVHLSRTNRFSNWQQEAKNPNKTPQINQHEPVSRDNTGALKDSTRIQTRSQPNAGFSVPPSADLSLSIPNNLESIEVLFFGSSLTSEVVEVT
ncbi:MAG: hypothetical protein K2Z81_17750 [Cyanobacteria bacterium]|nr:hypothetical protein [Cyanobacteriota bacterium]